MKAYRHGTVMNMGGPKRVVNAVLTAILFLSSALSQTAYDRTGRARNGRFWIGMRPSDQVSFLHGFSDGVFATNSVEATKIYTPTGTSFGELARFISRLYEDPENMGIPIKDAIRLFVVKLHGASAEQLQAEMAALRRLVQAERESVK